MYINTERPRRAARLAAAVVSILAAGSAQATDGVADLEQIVVIGTRLPMRAIEVPAMIHVQTAADVQQMYQSRTLPDALSEVPGVLVQKTANGQGSPFLRGFTGFRNVLLVDGIRLNNSVFREGPNQYWSTVDPYSFNTVEVLKGPSSVAYGSDAIGGAVNVISDIPDAGAPGLQGRVLYRYSSAESSDTVRLDGTYRGDSLRVHGGASLKDYGNVDAGGSTGVQPKTGYEEDDADLRVEYDIGADTSLLLGYQLVDQDDAWRTHRTIYGISWRGTQVGTDRELRFDQRRQLGYVQVQHDGVGAMADSLRASVSYHEQSEDQYRLRSNLRSDELGFDVRTTGLWLQFDKQWRSAQFVYGADWYSDDVSSYNVEYNADGSTRRVHVQGPVADDARYDLGGVFAQAIVRATPRFTATLGARYTFASVDAGRVEDPVTFAASSLEDDWDNFSGSARLAFAPVESGPWLVYAAVAQAFRAPNLSDLTRLDVARSGELETPSPGVEPETYVSYEFGVKYAGAKWSGQAAYFNTQGEDVIIRAPTGQVVNGLTEVTKVNAGETSVDGIEAEVSYAVLDRLSLFASGIYLDGEGDAYPSGVAADPVREPIDLLMPPNWRLGARWIDVARGLRLEALVEHADKQDELSTRDKLDTQRIPPGGTPAYTTFSLRSQWQVRPRVALSLAFENLTDEDYRVHGSGVNEPGRNVIASFVVGM